MPDGEIGIKSISISADASMLAAANNKGKCFVWKLLDEDTSKLEPLQKLEAHSKYILKCLFSPDSKYVCAPGGSRRWIQHIIQQLTRYTDIWLRRQQITQ